MKTSVKVTIVITGAVVLSTVAIQASDVLRGIDGGLSGLAIESTGPCDTHAVLVSLGSHAICMDVYEASPGNSCAVRDPQNELQTQQNVDENTCTAISVPSVTPWRHVTLTEAKQLCARTGKRLPTNEEWYAAAVGIIEEESCVVRSNTGAPSPTGSSGCVTSLGVHDMIGNVWEWVDEEIVDGVYHNRDLPEEGYVRSVDRSGIVLETGDNPDSGHGEDYAWTEAEGVYGLIRGGFYNSDTDGGIFAQNAAVSFDFSTAGIGFRCVEDVF